MFGLSTVSETVCPKKLASQTQKNKKNFLLTFSASPPPTGGGTCSGPATGMDSRKKSKMVVSAKSLLRCNLGRNFAEHRGTTDLLQTGDAEVIISAMTTGSRP
jgi:hypothetical protein